MKLKAKINFREHGRSKTNHLIQTSYKKELLMNNHNSITILESASNSDSCGQYEKRKKLLEISETAVFWGQINLPTLPTIECR